MNVKPHRDSADIVIVGNGVLAMFLACELARRSAGRVSVVGPAAREGAASRAAGAMLGCFGEISKDTLSTDAGRAKFNLSRAAHKAWPDVLAEFAAFAAERGEELHHVEDSFIVLNTCGGMLDSVNFAGIVAALDEFGEPWSEVEPAEIIGYQPRTDARALRVLHLPGEGAVDGRQILRLLEAKARSAGVSFVDAQVIGLEFERESVVGARLTNGDVVAADVVVVAAGAASGTLLRREGLMPTFAGAGVAVVARRVQGEGFQSVVRTPNRSGSCGLHAVPLGDDREYIGATNVLFEQPQTEAYLGIGNFLVDCAIQELDERIYLHRVVEWRVGNRPVALDGFPLVGWSDRAGLYILTGTYRDGFHCAPALVEHVASEIVDGDGVLDLPFSPTRPPIHFRSVEESVDEYVLHMMAGWFEAGGSAPSQISAETLSIIFRDQVRTLYDKLETTLGLPPEVLMFLLGAGSDMIRVLPILRYLKATSA